MDLSEAQIEIMLEKLDASLRACKIPKNRGLQVLTTFKSYISSTGMQYDVCQVCLGTGKQHNNELYNITKRQS